MEILLLKKISQLDAKIALYNPKYLGNHVRHNYGDTINSVCMGNDVRLYDSRNPLPHTHPLQDLPSNLVVSSRQITVGDGLIGGGDLSANRVISHADTSSQLSVVNSAANTFIKSIQLDTFGHIISIDTGSSVHPNNYVLGISGTGNSTFTLTRQGLTSLTVDLAHTHNWLSITDKPTTVAGYAISDVYTKTYIDNLFGSVTSGIRIQDPVKAATTANITLSGSGVSIDGVTVSTGDRVLVKNQTDKKLNGTYTVAAGTWTRAAELNESSEVDHGYFYYVQNGTVNGSTGWMLSLPEGTVSVLGTTEIEFKQFFAAQEHNVGLGLTKSGNTFSVDFNLVANKIHTHVISDIIAGILSVSNGGTGKSTIPLDEVLLGNGTGAIKTVPRFNIDTRTEYPPETHTHPTSHITTGTFPVVRGGTGLSTLTNNFVLVGNGTSNVSLISREGIDSRLKYDPTDHQHDGTHITTGTIAEARLPLTSDRLRRIIISAADPTGGANGDVWFKVY